MLTVLALHPSRSVCLLTVRPQDKNGNSGLHPYLFLLLAPANKAVAVFFFFFFAQFESPLTPAVLCCGLPGVLCATLVACVPVM